MLYTIIASILLFYALYMLLTVGIGLFYKSPNRVFDNCDHSLIVFFPIYKPGTQVIQNIKKQANELKGLNAKLFILSQEADYEIDEELAKLADHHISETFSHLPGNSYHYALEFAVNKIESFDSDVESVLLMDPDNFMKAASIKKLIAGRQSGYDVVLSRRKSYSKESSTSLFDGMSERLNDYMFRRSKTLLGFHPELSGSGMLMETQLFKQAVLKLDKKSPGMDKQLLIRMMFTKQDLTISYDESAIVFDEKTEDADAFSRQRLRWFGNQYYNAYTFGWRLLTSKSLSLIDYGISLWRPPRSFQIVGTAILVPFDMLAFAFDWIPAPIITSSAVLSSIAIIIFLINECMLKKVVVNILPLIWTSLKNGFTAITGSINSSGTFIHTRIEK